MELQPCPETFLWFNRFNQLLTSRCSRWTPLLGGKRSALEHMFAQVGLRLENQLVAGDVKISILVEAICWLGLREKKTQTLQKNLRGPSICCNGFYFRPFGGSTWVVDSWNEERVCVLPISIVRYTFRFMWLASQSPGQIGPTTERYNSGRPTTKAFCIEPNCTTASRVRSAILQSKSKSGSQLKSFSFAVAVECRARQG